MLVDLVDNKARYEDVYPSESEDEEENSDELDPTHIEPSEEVKNLKKEIEGINEALNQANGETASARGRLEILEGYGKSVEADRPKDLRYLLDQFQVERQRAYAELMAKEKAIRDLTEVINSLYKKQRRAVQKDDKARKKINKLREKELANKTRALEDKLKAKFQLKADRASFWAKKVYRVRISLDTNSDMTPASSRRQSLSIPSESTSVPAVSDACQISLSISYITESAYWAPRYDLSLSTPTRSGTITYRAEFSNTTSENWKDAKVILSTSQTAFQGLGEAIPTMQPWHVSLAKGPVSQYQSSSALYSKHELQSKQGTRAAIKDQTAQARINLFGLDKHEQQQQHRTPNQQMQQVSGHAIPSGHQSASADVRGNDVSDIVMFYKDIQARPRINPYDPTIEDSYRDTDTMVPELPSLTTQESSWSESGLTATYDIPGLRTINPSRTTRRHKIASIHLKDVHLSYLLIPKLRAAAFLKARIRNHSTIGLLKGPTGLTLDGSFLGNTTLPRCSAGESFSLSLGVDPSVSVIYGKPVVHRSRSGIISKAGSGVFTRTCTLTNTKANRAIEGLVLEQVPVSEDERLKIEVMQPKGLRQEGDKVRSGVGLNIAGQEDPNWGKATAIMKKAGEVCWDFKLEPSKGARLVLEYEARYPGGEQVVDV